MYRLLLADGSAWLNGNYGHKLVVALLAWAGSNKGQNMKSLTVGVVIFLAAVPVHAGHCRARVKVQRVVVQKVVKQIVAVPQVNNYYYPASVYAAPAPVQVQAAVLQPYYQPAPVQAVAAACCIPVCCPTAVVGGGVHPGPYPQPQPDPNPQPNPNPTPGTPSEFDEQVQTIFTRECISCHGDTKVKRKDGTQTSLDLRDVKLLTSLECHKAAAKIQLGAMPPDHPEKITDEEATMLLKWADSK